jgi:hypothetical protein
VLLVVKDMLADRDDLVVVMIDVVEKADLNQ